MHCNYQQRNNNMTKMMIKNIVFVVVGLLVSFAVSAAPAPWYLWKSKLDGSMWCTQTLPGDGWVKLDGPYKDAHCKIMGRPGK